MSQKENLLFLRYNKKWLCGVHNDGKKIKCKEKGNALFLILIAVALFAALSYAVTQSGRSGGGVDKETLRIQASEFIQQISLMRTGVQRLYALNEVSQIHFNDAAANVAGTIYNPDETAGTGNIVGLFNTAETGLSFIAPNSAFVDDSFAALFYVFNAQLLENSVDLGTSLGDEFIFTTIKTLEGCQELNRGLYGDKTVGVMTISGTNTSDSDIVSAVGVFTSFGTLMNSWDVPRIPGCAETGVGSGSYYYIEDIKRN